MKPYLILDANAFILQVDLLKLHQKYDFVSTISALAEVRDQNARERLRQFPFEIKQMFVSESSVRFTRAFATKTGDNSSLSDVDIELIALAYTILEENKKTNLIRSEPPKPVSAVFPKKISPLQSNNLQQLKIQAQEEEDNDGWELVVDNKHGYKARNPSQQVEVQENTIMNKPSDQIEETAQQPVTTDFNHSNKIQVEQDAQEIENDENGEVDDDESDDNNDEEWITNENILDHLSGISVVDEGQSDKLEVSLMTADYAMQNVLLQMGIPILCQDGFVVNQTRRFILECYVCKTIENDTSKLFCHECGNNALLKVSCSINSDGTIKLYRRKNFKVNLRGTQFSIPKASESKYNQVIVREDQLLMGGIQQRIRREQLQTDQKYKKMLLNYDNGFGFDDIEFRQNKAKTKLVVGYGRLNPNDINDMRKIKHKRQAK